jgi:hypothetical protein
VTAAERTADPSASLGMTKGRVAFQVAIGCRDPKSEKRDLGRHPAVVADAAGEGQVRIHGANPKWNPTLSLVIPSVVEGSAVLSAATTLSATASPQPPPTPAREFPA